MQRFEGKVAVVTGATSGIGEAIAKELTKRGLIVFGLARRLEKLQAITRELQSENNNGEFHPIKCDITQEEDIKKAFNYINTHKGAPSILVNNAGVSRYIKEFEDINGSDFDAIFDTNSKGLLLASIEAIKLMEANSISGHILNINSIAGCYMPLMPTKAIYSGSKHASRIFSESLRRLNVERKGNIKITNISPGLVKTELTDYLYKGSSDLDDPNICVTAEDIAKACVSVLDTPPNVLISELTIMPIHQQT